MPGGRELSQLERRLEAIPSDVVGRVGAWWRGRPRVERVARAIHYQAVWGAPGLGRALGAAIAQGALESAEGLFEALRQLPDSRLDSEALLALLDGALLLGRIAEVADLARGRRCELRKSSRGAALLTLFGLAGPTWLPDGRPNLLEWSRQLAAGALDAEDLAALASRRLGPWLR